MTTISKEQRLDLIRDFIKENKVRTQEELVVFLQSRGYNMTQATVSRDVADIGLKKNSAGNYVLAQEEELKTILKTLVKKVTYSANIVLINTLPAAGQTVASYLDKSKLDGVMGSVAGDDTIFLLVAEDHDAETITIELRALKED